MQGSTDTYIFIAVAVAMTGAALLFLLKPMKKESNQTLSLVLAVIIPVAAAILYMAVGTPEAVEESSSYHDIRPETRASTQGRKAKSVNDLLIGLEGRLEQDPGDADGWLLLAKSYEHVGRDADAEKAYAKARELGAPNVGPTRTSRNETSYDLDNGPVIRGTVTASDDTRDSIGEGDVVFVFAKESKEHRMPVAAIRRPASALPFEFSLSNADVMIRDADISKFKSLVVTARLSRSGLATDREGSVEVWSSTIDMADPGAAVIDLVLGGEVDQ